MRWPLAAVAIVCVSGCASQAPMTNPFLGPTTVPPPPTGSAGTAPPADPYYQNPAATPGYQAPAYQPPATNPGYGTPSYQPPGGYAPQGSGTRPLNNGGYGLLEPAREKVRTTAGLRLAEEPAATSIAAVDHTRKRNNASPTRQAVARVDVPATDAPSNSALSHATVRGNQTSPSVDHSDAQPSGPIASSNDHHAAPPDNGQPDVATLAADADRPQGTVIRIIEPRADTVGPSTADHQAGVEPRRFEQPDELIDINDLPRVDETAATPSVRRSDHASSRTAVSRASFTTAQPSRTFASDPVGTSHRSARASQPSPVSVGRSSNSTSAPAATDRGRYGYDTSYKTLRGRLEYSATRRRWKLRYIPHDANQTDQFGGSVELTDNGQLSHFEPGDFVVVEGTLTESQGDTYDFAPQYRVASIRRQ